MSKDIEAWLDGLNLGQYAATFADNDIDLDILGELNDADLKELGVSMGDRKRILRALGGSEAHNASPGPQPVPSATEAAGSHEADTGVERRQLTVMFCDLVDSTGLSVRVDPEDLRHIISSFQKCCERVVEIFGGSVARYMGDGALVYFGYPVASEHDCERAVRAGLELTRAVGQLNVGKGIVLQTRVGIATGEVIVGDLIGEGKSQEHAVIGETPNLAARLQGLAEPDMVVVSHTTRRLVGGLFEYRDLGSHLLKGFESPVRAWQVGEESQVESRFEAMHGSAQLRPLLGRAAETEVMLERWTRARDGSGQAILVLGEAGIGKSRLSQALRDRITGEPHKINRYFCVPYHQKSALFPVVSNIERGAGISRTDKPDMRLRKVEALVANLSGDPAELVPLYADLLGIPLDARYKPLGISPRLQKERTLQVLEQHLTDMAADQPLLLIFEDLHWIDPTSMELIGNVLTRLHHLPILLVMTARPEFLSPWPDADNFVSLHLEKLGSEFVEELIHQVTGKLHLPEQIVALIRDKTDGVPLFVEELTKTLIESGQLLEQDGKLVIKGKLPDLAIPDTLQDSLLARLDRLGNGKKIAQIGSAIGRVFSYELVARIASDSREELSVALERLAASGLVFREGTPPRSEYIFKHALVQDAAYSTLLKTRRLALHKKIADTLELYFPQVARREPESLAHHYTCAEEFDKAIPHWESAARMAIDRAAHEEAHKHLGTAMDLLEKLPPGRKRMELELGLQLAMGLAMESTRGYAAPEVEKAYDRARQICEELKKTAELAPVLLGLYIFNFVRGDFNAAKQFADRAVEISKASKRLDYLIESYAALGYVECHLGDLAAARETLESAVSLYESRTDGQAFVQITAQDPNVASRVLLAIIEWDLGNLESSERHMERGLALAEALGHSINFAVAYAHAAEYYTMRRDYTKAVEMGQLGMQVSIRHGHEGWFLQPMMHVGIARSLAGEPEEGLPQALQGIELWQAAGARINSSYFLGATALALHAAGRHKEAVAMMQDAFAACEFSSEHFHLSRLHCYYGEMLMGGPAADTKAAEQHFVAAVETAVELGAASLELRALRGLHEIQVNKDKGALTASRLQALVEHFSGGPSFPDLEDAKRTLAEEAAQDEVHS